MIMDKLDKPLEEMEFSERTTRVLSKAGYKTLRDIVVAKKFQILKTPGLGRKSFNEIKEVIICYGYHFDMQILTSANHYKTYEEALQKIEDLKLLLEQRDCFILYNNLWDQFIASLEDKKEGEGL